MILVERMRKEEAEFEFPAFAVGVFWKWYREGV